MSALVPCAGAVGVLALAVVRHGTLTGRVQRLFAGTTLLYSQLDVPSGIDLRRVIENPRLFYFALAATGSILRILLGVATLLFFDVLDVGTGAFIEAAIVLAILAGAELAGRALPSRDAPIGEVDARVMWLVGLGVRLLPGGEDEREPPGVSGREVVSTVDGQEIFGPDARRFLEGLLALDRAEAGRAMVPLEDMVTVREHWTVARAARVACERRFPRVPVLSDDGRVIGLAHSKDLLLLQHTGHEKALVRSVMSDVRRVRADERLDRLLVEFQTHHLHVGVVEDESGRAVGFVTMDDILTRALTPGEGS